MSTEKMVDHPLRQTGEHSEHAIGKVGVDANRVDGKIQYSPQLC
jgi:hypothetical protein